jgi:Xaa-Pro aminopeptidase
VTALAPMDHAARRDRLRATLDGTWLLVSAPVNVRYLSGFAGSAGQVLIGPSVEHDRIITDDRYEERVAVDAPDLQAAITRDPVGAALNVLADRSSTAGAGAGSAAGTERADARVSSGGVGAAGGGVGTERTDARVSSGGEGPAGGGAGTERADARVSSGGPGARGSAAAGAEGPLLGVEADHLSWAAAEALRARARDDDVEVVGTTGAVAALRLTKDDAEVARLERACRITTDALAWLFDEVVAPGVTERQLALALERRFIDLGADGVAFPSIVASGPNAAIPHHQPSVRPIEVGDVLTVDCGASVDGYHADCTRTVGVHHLDEALQEIYEVVRQAQAAGRAAAVLGASAGDVDAAARGVVADAGYGQRFLHGTGHGVGLEIHEAPAVARGSGATLAVGTTLTVEPGVYVPGLGGVRIEDTLVIGADGLARVLTDAPRELRLL